MSEMASTFTCPHCQAVYPVKPVLVGRAVRCTTCKHAFRLREDGVADKIADSAQAQPEPQKPVAPAPTESGTQPSQTPARSSISSRTAAMKRTRELSATQEEARRTLAANLSSAASVALEAEQKKDESTRIRRKKTEPHYVPRKKTDGGGVGDIGPAVLSDFGEREYRNARTWIVGCAVAIVAVMGAIWLSTARSDQYLAVETYASPVDHARNYHGERIAAIQERAWLPGTPPLVGIGTLSIGKSRTIAASGVGPVFSETLKGFTYVANAKVWADTAHAGTVEGSWNEKIPVAKQIERLAKTGAKVVEHAQVLEKIKQAGLSDEDVDVVDILLRKGKGGDEIGSVAERFQRGEVPNMEVTRFSGKNGLLLVNRGGRYTTRPVSYEGHLMRCLSPGWRRQWRVLDLQVTSETE
jgi:predicted Zn finger-like uncharacterized protein